MISMISKFSFEDGELEDIPENPAELSYKQHCEKDFT